MDPTCTEAAEELASVRSLLALKRSPRKPHRAGYGDPDCSSDDESESELIPVVSLPALDESDRDMPFESDTSDFHQQGFGVPCRYYNHGGCARGRECRYKHAPDDRSVRNNLYACPHPISLPYLTHYWNTQRAKRLHLLSARFLPLWRGTMRLLARQGVS